MSKELVVKSKTEVATRTQTKDILTLYGVPEMLDQFAQKEKNDLLNILCCGAIGLDSVSKLTSSKGFAVEIPLELREMVMSGKAVFDQSRKRLGGFTPNIRIKGEAGIKGQATIIRKVDSQTVSQTLSNLAVLAMVQSVLEELDTIKEKVEDIKRGQENDRIGCIIGSFKAFMDLYPTLTSLEEIKSNATSTYREMQKGLAQLHLQIDEKRKKLNDAPINEWQALKKCFHLYNSSKRYQEQYESFIYDLQLYNRLILLSDVVLIIIGDKAAVDRNHKVMVDYCNLYLNNSFKQRMNFLMHKKAQGIDAVLHYNEIVSVELEELEHKGIRIECKYNDFQTLNNEEQ